MKIYKSINNNIVTALDSDGMEVIVVGKGIGYHAKEGTELNPASIQKVYRMENQKDTDRLKALFSSLPPVYIEVTDEIFCYAKRVLNKRLNERAYISLADHIHFAAQRHRDGLDFSNPLLNEIRRFYSVEYQIGLYALEIIRKRLNITFPCDEAASIAIHILDAEYDISVKGTFDAAKLMNGILDIVENKEHFKIHDGDYYHERFLTHLKFLTLRIVKNQPFTRQNREEESRGRPSLLRGNRFFHHRCNRTDRIFVHVPCTWTVPCSCRSDRSLHGHYDSASDSRRLQLQRRPD
jgi:beta-glucoside operon transcriptional antiterminator